MGTSSDPGWPFHLKHERAAHPVPRGALFQSPKELSEPALKLWAEDPSQAPTLLFGKAISFLVLLFRACW